MYKAWVWEIESLFILDTILKIINNKWKEHILLIINAKNIGLP